MNTEVLVAGRADVGREPGVSRAVLIGVFLLLEVVWLATIIPTLVLPRGPSGKGLAADFGMLAGAAQVTAHGGNPYDNRLLYATESRLLHRQGLPINEDRSIVRVGNPPLYLWALQPFLRLPFRIAAYLWLALLATSLVVGFLLLLRRFGWSQWVVPCAVFLLLPQVIKAVYHGNSMALVFGAVCCSLALARRHGFLAGLVLVLAWVKPQIGLFPVLLIFLFHAPQRGRLMAGFGAGTGAMIALTFVTTGWQSVAYWLQGLAGYSHDVAPQKVVPSLAGLYVLWAPWNLRLVLTGLCLAAAVALTVVWWWRLRNIADVPFLAVAWLWLVWFLATPYVHIDDEVLLVIPVLALVGRNGDRLTQPLPVLALLLLFFAPLPSTWMVVMLAFPALLLALHAMSHPMATLRWALIAYGLLALSLVMSVLWLPVDGGSLKLLALAVCLFGAVPPELVPRPDQREVGIGLGSWAARLRAG